MSEEVDALKEEYDDDIELMHARLQIEIGKTASRSLAGNVRFVAKQTARHHVLKGLMRGKG